MIIKGLQKLTLIDYPNTVACTIFTFGCNLRCPYCHNPELVVDDGRENIDVEEIFQFLEERKNFLDGVCITGGEPTLQNDLPEFMSKIKQMEFLIKLDTNGTNPEMIEQLIKNKLIDYIAMDIKAPLERYEDVCKSKVDLDSIKKSVDLIKNSGIDYEFRTTVPPQTFEEKDFLSIGKWLEGSKKFYIQQFKGIKTLDKSFIGKESVSANQLNRFFNILKPFFQICGVR